jgi:hypothetical protein
MVYSNTGGTRSFSPNAKIEWHTNANVATSDSTTDPSPTGIIPNDGNISALAAVLKVTKGGGTNPTASLTLQGTMSNLDATSPTWVTVLGSGATSLAATASDIATAATNNIVQQINTANYGLKHFPFRGYRFVNDLGGTNPTWEGSIDYAVEKNPVRTQL